MVKKIIPFNVAIKSTATRRSYDIPKAYTNDLNSVEFQFTITDMTAEELTTAKANVLLYMLDGSFFENNEASGVTIEGNVVTYTMKSNEGNHRGVNEAQVEIIYEGAPDKKLASQKYEFEIINGLDMEVAVEIVVKDWSALTTEARKFIDDSTVEVNALKTELQNSIETANTSLGEFDVALETGIVAANLAEKLEDFEEINNSRLLSTERQLEQANERIDAIIVTPAEGITEQEIIDARDGETTLRNRLEKNQETSNQMVKLFDPFNKFYKFKKPTGFVWTPPIDIYHNGDKLFYTDFDVATFAPAIGTGKTYYVTTTGHYANDGLTIGTALDSVKTAINKGDAGLVLVSPGIYDLNRIWGNPVFGRNVQIKKNGEGRVIISYHLNDVWTLASGYTKTYTTKRANVRHVFDAKYPDYLGDYKKYVLKSTVAEVEATAGSYAQIGTALYIHSIDDRKPDVDTRPYLSGGQETAQIQQSVSVYVEGIEFEGSFRPFYAQNSSANPTGLKIYMKDCKFKYSNNGSGMTVVGAEECFLQNCETSRHYFDGFSYTGAYGVEPKGIEVDCIGRNIGGIDAGGGTSCNGSTSHKASHIVRFRGSYFENYGANIADVNDGTESWNIACSCHESTITEDVATNSDFMVGNGISKMWIDSCVSFGSLYGIASTTADALVFLRKTNPDKNANITANVSVY